LNRRGWIKRLRIIQRSIDLLLRDMETGPENSREEVAPMIDSPQRDCPTARLAAA
jgi:hypothetical protein